MKIYIVAAYNILDQADFIRVCTTRELAEKAKELILAKNEDLRYGCIFEEDLIDSEAELDAQLNG